MNASIHFTSNQKYGHFCPSPSEKLQCLVCYVQTESMKLFMKNLQTRYKKSHGQATILECVKTFSNLQNVENSTGWGGPQFLTGRCQQATYVSTGTENGLLKSNCRFRDIVLHPTEHPGNCRSHVPAQCRRLHQERNKFMLNEFPFPPSYGHHSSESSFSCPIAFPDGCVFQASRFAFTQVTCI